MRRERIRTTQVPAGPLAPRLTPPEVVGCPVRASLGLLGRKWAMILVRDLAFYPSITFGQILRRNPRLTPRVLSMRLREFRAEGLIEKVADPVDDRVFHYRLTDKGMDAVPIMTAHSAYGLKHRADEVFPDGRPRTLAEVFPDRPKELLGELYGFAHRRARAPAARRRRASIRGATP